MLQLIGLQMRAYFFLAGGGVGSFLSLSSTTSPNLIVDFPS